MQASRVRGGRKGGPVVVQGGGVTVGEGEHSVPGVAIPEAKFEELARRAEVADRLMDLLDSVGGPVRELLDFQLPNGYAVRDTVPVGILEPLDAFLGRWERVNAVSAGNG